MVWDISTLSVVEGNFFHSITAFICLDTKKGIALVRTFQMAYYTCTLTFYLRDWNK